MFPLHFHSVFKISLWVFVSYTTVNDYMSLFEHHPSVMPKSVFSIFFNAEYGLKCYQCATTTSYEDCDDIRKEVTCLSGLDRCFKGSVSVQGEGRSVVTFEKGCTTKHVCDNLEDSLLCKDKLECEISCCAGDFCNTAATQVVSFVVLITCVLVALTQLRIFQQTTAS